jgi:aminoglycoside N3'-acetyltransferase
MSRPYYVHSDLFTYLSAFPKLAESAKSSEEIAGNTFVAMKKDLEEISDGQLVVPTYNYQFAETNLFDVRNDRSEVGQFSEQFRKHFDGFRSFIPIFSSSASFDGFLMQKIVDEVDPFGNQSDFASLVAADGVITTFGSTFIPTFIIYIEKQIKDGSLYRYEKDFSGKIIDFTGVEREITLLNFVRPRQIEIKYDLLKVEADLEQQGILSKHILRDNFSYSLCSAAQFLIFALEKLESDPFYLLTAESIQSLKNSGAFDRSASIQDFD